MVNFIKMLGYFTLSLLLACLIFITAKLGFEYHADTEAGSAVLKDLKKQIDEYASTSPYGKAQVIKIQNPEKADLLIITSAYLSEDYLEATNNNRGIDLRIPPKLLFDMADTSSSSYGSYAFLIKQDRLVSSIFLAGNPKPEKGVLVIRLNSFNSLIGVRKRSELYSIILKCNPKYTKFCG